MTQNSSFTIQPFRTNQLPDVLALLHTALPSEPLSSAQFTRQILLDPNFDSDGALAAVNKDRVVGFCLAIARRTPLENAPPDNDRGYITLFATDPERRRTGVGTALLEAAEEYLRSRRRRMVLVAPYAPGYFMPGVDLERYPEACHLLERQGYRELYRAISMQNSLWSFSCPAWLVQKATELAKEGVQLQPFSPEIALPLLEFVQREFPGDWVRVVRETAGRILRGDSPDRLMAVVQGNSVLGFSHYENERFGPIGVGMSERGRSLGHLLMFATLHAQKDAGFRTAWFLWSDRKTADRIYRSAGFEIVREFAIFRKDLE